MRTNPHILEINTRAWMKRLERRHGQKFTLDQIPDNYWTEIKALGFDAVWLMGVWKHSPKATEIARTHPDVVEAVRKIEPHFDTQDIVASPYAIMEYVVDDSLGGPESLKKLRAKLNGMGVAVFLDFVANHTAIDAPTVETDPDLYINTGTAQPHVHADWFFTNKAGVHIAHGRDPYFAPWTDTAQLNYFNPKTRRFMLDNLLRVAEQCDGVRCDMAMLSLNKVHRDTWRDFLGNDLPKEEFWTQALKEVRDIHPEFTFIAEVYWGLEWEIQEMGFDYTYDKVLYDRLRFSNSENIKAHLGAEHLFQMRSIRFTSNHDEEESLKAFGKEKSLAASTIIATLPGARMFYLFQLLGRPARLPIQYVKDWFTVDKEVATYYARLLTIASAPEFHGGQWSLKEVRALNDDSYRNVLAWQWKQRNTGKMVVINYSNQPSRCCLAMKGTTALNGSVREEFSKQQIEVTPQMRAEGFTLELKPYESKIFTFSL